MPALLCAFARDTLLRLSAKKVLGTKPGEGEAPYDILVRWKPLEQQPIGWYPDLNDGVRLNIARLWRLMCCANVRTLNGAWIAARIRLTHHGARAGQ